MSLEKRAWHRAGFIRNKGGGVQRVGQPARVRPHGRRDGVDRLDRDARVNIALGFLLPSLILTVAQGGSNGFEPLSFTLPQTLIWRP